MYVVCMGGSLVLAILGAWILGPPNIRGNVEVGIACIMILASLIAFANGVWHAYHTRLRRNAVLYVLICYFSLDAFFGAGYFILYYNDSSAFHFTRGIQQRRIVEQFDGIMESVLVLNKTLNALAILHSFPGDVIESELKEPTFVERERKCSHAGTTVVMSQEVVTFDEFASVSYTITITDQRLPDAVELEAGGELQFHVAVAGHKQIVGVRGAAASPGTLYHSENAREFHGAVEDLIEGIKVERDRQLTALEKNVRGEGEWRLLDFLYLSTVTLTTLGFGDVVPNNGAARAAIMCESVAGVLLLAFALVMFMPMGKSDIYTSRPAE